ncbi:MAG: tetratricopeptide repeat protein [Acidobacteriales bacterium]|nr:tetratricopeptide repeat protein [Terriglobales bacterium]
MSAVGYEPSSRTIQVTDTLHATKQEIILRADPAAIDLEAGEEPMSAKARKATKRATADLKSGKFKDARKQLVTAAALAPNSETVMFLRGYLALQDQDMEGAKRLLTNAVAAAPRDAQALELLGRLQLQSNEYGLAVKTLERATAASPSRALPHSLLGSAYLCDHEYGKAESEASTALQLSHGELASSYVVLGQALAATGRKAQGVEALNIFLKRDPNATISLQVRDLIAKLESGHEPVALMAEPLVAAEDTKLISQPWQPVGIDEVHPAIAAGVACPLEHILSVTGTHMDEFVEDLAKFSAVEDLLHERLDKAGYPLTRESRKFDYVAAVSRPSVGALTVQEFRSGRYNSDELPDRIVTNGFPALALIFHPDLRDGFEMKCEGLGQLNSQATWLIHFQQREDRPKRIQDYVIDGVNYPVDLKGRAWISADQLQIIRIETELVKPVAAIHLEYEHQITEYGPVNFVSQKTQLWLPKQAEVYMDFRKRLYYRKHSFDHFKLFSVDAQDAYKAEKHSVRKPN